MRILIQRAWIINEGQRYKGSLLIEDDIIKSIFRDDKAIDIPEDTVIIEADGLTLIPGIIDEHVHFREPGLTHKADMESESVAALAGGITSIMEMPNTIPQTTSIQALREKQELAARRCLCNYSFYLGATNDNIEEILNTDPETTCGIKVFMGASTGNMLVDDAATLDRIFSESPVPVGCHCEEEDIVRKNLDIYRERHGDNIPASAHPAIRSREACLKSSSKAVTLAQMHNAHLHVLHLSTADEMDLFTAGPVEDKKITAEVCVHHLWFDDDAYSQKDNLVKWNPAVKTAYDRNALIRALNEDKIDTIATDHAPHTLEEKQQTYLKAPSGGPLVQHALPAMIELSKQGLISMEKVVEKMCHNPAVIYRLKERGYIREGYKADLCLINMNNEWTVSRDNILYKCGWSPFEGQPFSSRVEKTFVNGRLAYDQGRINNEIKGELLKFKR